MKKIEYLAQSYFNKLTRSEHFPTSESIPKAFIEGSKIISKTDNWIELPTKELLSTGYYAIRISHNGFVDVKFDFIDNQIIPYHYATHYYKIILPLPPK